MERYRAVRADPATVRDELVRLWSANLPVHGDVVAKHRWLYLDGPAGPAEAFVLRASDGATVGCAGIARRELWSAGRPLRAALFADFAIERAHRTGLPAIVLQRAVKHHVDAEFDLAYGMPNAKAVAVYHRIGFPVLGKMARYVRVLRHGGYLEREYVAHRARSVALRGPAVLAARAAGMLLDGPHRVGARARAFGPRRRGSLVWPSNFDSRFDLLWRETRDLFGIVCRRDAEFLRWRFLSKPDEHDAVAALVNNDGRLRAYAVVTGARGGTAELRDAFGSLAALDDLLALLAPELHARGHTAIGFRFLGDPRIPALLHAHHFSLRDDVRAVVASAGASCALDRATVLDPVSWYLTDLDEDT